MTRHPHVTLARGRVTPDGRRRCCWCGEPVGARRRDWCSDNCVQRYQIASGDQGAARRWLWRVDQGVCQLCLVDTVRPCEVVINVHTGEPLDRAYWWPSGQWEADHTIPIVEGGDLTPENLRTLCVGCHRGETAKLRRRMADRRREAAA